MSRPALGALSLAILPGALDALKCGFVTDAMPACPECLEAALNTSVLDFWWNWKTDPEVDLSGLSVESQRRIRERFVPMLWSQASPAGGYGFLSTQTHVMGYNEPDMYGPSCFGEWDPPPYGCGKGDTRPATSSGWKELFDPSSAAQFWQRSVNTMTEQPRPSSGGVRTLVSPSMAQNALPGESCVGVDPAMAGAIKVCPGWLKVFKENTMKLPCTDFSGARTNCWDAIDVIQIHAYARTAQEVKDKINDYFKVFQEDFEGTNGRKKKKLWLTEVAMGTSKLDEALHFVEALMNPIDGLSNSDKFGFLEKVSWFSEFAFQAFNLPNYKPRKFEVWSSSLFNPFGTLSPLGERFFSYCEPSPPPSRRLLEKSTRLI